VCIPFGGTWYQVGSDINGKASGDWFGQSVAMSADGKTIAIGASRNDNANGTDSGHVRVYSINTTSSGWIQVGSDIIGEAMNDISGYSVAISADGKTIAIGAPANYNTNGVDSGHVRVYAFNVMTGSWKKVGVDIDGKAAGDNSGASVTMSGDGKTIAIGSPFHDGLDIAVGVGQVRVFSLNSISGNWAQVGIDIDGEASGDVFGLSVAISMDGKRLVIGATGNDVNGMDAGYVRVYSINTTSGSLTQVGMAIYGKAAGDQFGNSVAISSNGNVIAVGATYNDNVRGANSGQVRVYSFNITTGGWIQIGLDINGEAADDKSGASVAMSADGTTIAIGAVKNNNANGTDSGHVRVYSLNSTSGSWAQVGFDIDGEAAGDQSGYSIAISADGFSIVIGAPFNNGNGLQSGHARVYKYALPTTPPTKAPSKSPTKVPTKRPTKVPTKNPTKAPSKNPTRAPSMSPTNVPTKRPTKAPTRNPTKSPSKLPTKIPTKSPSKKPTKRPTNAPTKNPSKSPTKQPTKLPSKPPTKFPTKSPTTFPTKGPTRRPTTTPTNLPSKVPSQVLFPVPMNVPTACGLFGWNFFCPRQGKCGFWRRLLHLHGC
jgi:hypothetical protein